MIDHKNSSTVGWSAKFRGDYKYKMQLVVRSIDTPYRQFRASL